jgi:CheY-like chemotaxis protein
MANVTTILLVEDEILLRRAFRTLLEASGYRVSEAGSAAEAIERAADRPDLVLLDLGLPDRNGLDIVGALRERAARPDLPVVAMTGQSGPEAERACAAAGCVDHLVKPVGPRELVRRIPDWLGPAKGARAETPA